MKIEQFRIDGFGRLSGLETESLGDLVAVVGPNEAGKSTLFHFLTTALYGFQPASRERNPHVPWDADEAGGVIRVRLSDDRCAVVERRLRSAPKGLLRLGSEETDLRNQPVPWVGHVPRGVFRQVFAITLAELAGLDSETWLSIQDRVLGSMGASDLRGARAVAEQLEQEAGEIWRPSRRGNQRLRELRAETRILKGRRQEALERDRRIRSLVEERENERVHLREARAERQALKVSVEVTTELLPIRRRLERIAELREVGGDAAELGQLPERLVEAVSSLRSALDEARARAESIAGEVEELEAASRSVTDEQRRILEHEGEVHRLAAAASNLEPEWAQRAAHDAELSEIIGRGRAIASQLFDAEPTPRAETALASLSISLLRDRLQRLDSRNSAQTDTVAPPETTSRRDASIAAGVIAVGVGVWMWGFSTNSTVLTSVGVALAALGAAWGLMTRRRPTPEAPTHNVESTDELDDDVRRMLEDLPLRAEWLERRAPALADDLGRLQELGHARASLEERLADLDRRSEALRGASSELADQVGLSVPAEPGAVAAVLRQAIQRAQDAIAEARTAERERGRLEHVRGRAAAEADRLDGEVASIIGRVFGLTGATDLDAVERVERRIVAHAEADRLERELLREHPDLDELRERIRVAEDAEVPWTQRADEMARQRSRIEELDVSIEAGVARAEALDGEVAHLRRLETPDTVDSALIEAREAETTLARTRDRKWILAQLIREADRRFREEHQPDLIRRASEHLRTLTDGRYHGLIIDESGGKASFQLVGAGLPKPIPLAPPISTGTIEQAYLSLRLAIVDHLDEGSETLPLFVDEAFVNWDAARRDRGLDTLSRLSQKRQIFAFTCHPGMAARLEAHGARVLELDR